MNTLLVKNNFSKSAATYDLNSGVQKKCAGILAEITGGKDYLRILEIGCGTAFYTSLLAQKFEGAFISAVDFSQGMLEMARKRSSWRNVDFILSDIERNELCGKYDLVTSNASFQWFSDVEKVLSKIYGVLDKGGSISFSLYGKNTFKELNEVLNIHFGGSVRLSSNDFFDKAETEKVVSKYFAPVNIFEEHFTEYFPTFLEFLKSIKNSGTRGEGIKGDLFLGKNALKEIEKTYVDKYGAVKVTHHVIFVSAKKAGRDE
ncbi:MAG: methyltransferase domain-containing protein [Candidatus Omnitrophica bacterium]|nr:methyltransferase domain-containing protein [Candidatus Omnitrophota bacterium]